MNSLLLFLIYTTFINSFALVNGNKVQNVLRTEVFAITIDPMLFNWTYEGKNDQFSYEATLSGYPDLPSWIHFVFSSQHHTAYLYGVPPNHSANKISLDVVGLNKNNYETRVTQIDIIIQEKLNTAKNEVHLKINNLNVVDMFDVVRMDSLKEIFIKNLWKDSENDLYVTFMESAVELGARKPLDPKEGEGVVVRLGSEFRFSSELLELQEEVRPLYKMQSCPRNFKRTSVERLFRDAEFLLDWCSFHLIEKNINNSAMHEYNTEELIDSSDLWYKKFKRAEIPVRSYNKDLILSIALPTIILTGLVVALSLIICFIQDDIIGISEESLMDEETKLKSSPQRFIESKQVSGGGDFSASIMNQNNEFSDIFAPHSPNNSTIIHGGMHCRPSPPPYVRPKFKPEI